MWRRWTRIASVLLSVLTLLHPQAVLAQAQGVALTGEELGLKDPIRLRAPYSEDKLFIPIPGGLQPLSLDLEVATTANVVGGHLVFESHGRMLLTLPLPADEARVTVPLADLDTETNLLTLSVSAFLDSEVETCDLALTTWVELRDLTVQMAGEPAAPNTLGGFWLRPLRRLLVWLPEDLTADLATAALQMTAIGVHQAAGASVDLQVRFYEAGRLDLDALEAGPFDRIVVLGIGESRRVRLEPLRGGAAAVVLEGPRQALVGLTRALARVSWEALPGEEVVLEAFEPQREASLTDRVTLEALGLPGSTLRGAGPMRLEIPFSQPDLGGPVRNVRLHLAGRHSPVPDGGQAALVVWLNDAVVSTARLEEGRWVVMAAVPDSLLRRDNVLTLEVLYTPPGGRCRFGEHEMVFQMDPGSYLTFERGQGLPPGFGRFPQAFLDAFPVAIEPLDPVHLEAALHLVAALQRLSPRPLEPEVLPVTEVLQAGSGLLVTDAPETWETVEAPLGLEPFRLVGVAGVELMRVETGAPFAALVAVESNGGDWLLLGAQLDPTLATLLVSALGEGDGWFALHGDVHLRDSLGPARTLRLKGSGLRAEPLPEPGLFWWERLRPLAFGLGLLVAVLFLVWAYPRVVRPWRGQRE